MIVNHTGKGGEIHSRLGEDGRVEVFFQGNGTCHSERFSPREAEAFAKTLLRLAEAARETVDSR